MEHLGKGVFEPDTGVNAGVDATRGRDSLFLMAKMRMAGRQPVDVRVRNLSAGGLMVELPYPVAPEGDVEVEVRGLGWIAGRIAWQIEGRAGVAFDREIDPQRARKTPGDAQPTVKRFGRSAFKR
ncbi:PilZ domain-containing protein [Sphingomonas palmae]|uniref:PilZ domain-containing protein n=1 Tax=Sphingomonas palmae TaxID=1855283 RepID=A0A1H7I2H6_9SPHN|nr:PilZ domain-containing protein [Sphingomonas palmae]SEK56574.1 PilZ domain-containing protein [Sphingomonas palmae]